MSGYALDVEFAIQSSLYNAPELFWVRQLGQILFYAQNDYPIYDFQNKKKKKKHFLVHDIVFLLPLSSVFMFETCGRLT